MRTPARPQRIGNPENGRQTCYARFAQRDGNRRHRDQPPFTADASPHQQQRGKLGQDFRIEKQATRHCADHRQPAPALRLQDDHRKRDGEADPKAAERIVKPIKGRGAEEHHHQDGDQHQVMRAAPGIGRRQQRNGAESQKAAHAVAHDVRKMPAVKPPEQRHQHGQRGPARDEAGRQQPRPIGQGHRQTDQERSASGHCTSPIRLYWLRYQLASEEAYR